MDKTNITNMSNAHSGWLRDLEFYKTELNTLKARLTEIAGKNTGRDVAGQIEHYENQMKVQAENIDALTHNIRSNTSLAAREAQDSAGHIDKDVVTKHNELEQKVLSEEKVVNELRQSFNRFASEWL